MADRQTTRRDFLTSTAAIVTGAIVAPAIAAVGTPETMDNKTTGGTSQGSAGAFTLPPLPYPHSALEPHIDAETMQIHHGKHHDAYVKKLNEAVASAPELAGKSAEELVRNLESLPEAVRMAVRNQGGGHVNHSMFWEIMTPGGASTPTGDLAEAIKASFGSLDEMKKKFNEAGVKQFGSGWVWLVLPKGAAKLQILSTPNQDNPITRGDLPILGNDVWEHAYYLKYRNKRPDYLAAWWNVVNWDKVAERFEKSRKG